MRSVTPGSTTTLCPPWPRAVPSASQSIVVNSRPENATNEPAAAFFLAAADENESASFQPGETTPPVRKSGSPRGFGVRNGAPLASRSGGEPAPVHHWYAPGCDLYIEVPCGSPVIPPCVA